jgi:hypothetical protein
MLPRVDELYSLVSLQRLGCIEDGRMQQPRDIIDTLGAIVIGHSLMYFVSPANFLDGLIDHVDKGVARRVASVLQSGPRLH